MPLKDLHDQISINVVAHMELVRYFAPRLVKRRLGRRAPLHDDRATRRGDRNESTGEEERSVINQPDDALVHHWTDVTGLEAAT